MSVNLKTRGLIFATFFGSIFIIGLLVAALTTSRWLEAEARHHTIEKAHGKILLGLFSGTKSLNKKYGYRTNTTEVSSLIQEDVMNYLLWILTTLGVGLGLFASFIGGVASVIRAASAARKHGTMLILFVANFTSCAAQFLAFICWLIQFFQKLTHNVLLAEDVSENWYTTGLASLGHSFYFVVFGALIALANIILLSIAVHIERQEARRMEDDLCDDKTHGAIMLY